MASTSSTMAKPEMDASLQVLTSIMEKLSKEEQQKLGPFLSDIEGQILRTIEGVPEEKVKRKRREVIFAAAIYDTFLQYHQHTRTKVSLTIIAESLGLKATAVNSAWLALFDNRIKVDVERIEPIRGKSKNPKRLTSEVISNLKHAVPQASEDLDRWFTDVEKEAKELIGFLEKQALADYPPDMLAVGAVYSVIRRQGKPLVPLIQLDASLMCRTSLATISKLWVDIFHEGRGA
ncbi:MAG: hypothetical protein ACTSSD_15790, partial [Candidatus Thorarchaeota archaeon]